MSSSLSANSIACRHPAMTSILVSESKNEATGHLCKTESSTYDWFHRIDELGDKALRLWEVASQREIARFEGHTENVRSVSFLPDGCHIISRSEDNTLRLWEVTS